MGKTFFREEVCTVMRVSLEEEEWRDGCDPTEQGLEQPKQGQGPGDTHSQEVAKGKKSNVKEAEEVAGKAG